MDFDPGIGTHILTAIGGNEKDMFILKLNQNGNFLWVKQYGDSGGDQGFFLTKDENSDIYVSGYINSESFMAQVDPDETEDFIWKVEFIGPDYVSINSISLNKDGMLLSTGGFHDMADFDPGSGLYILTSQGNRDIFIHKLNERTVGVDEKTVATSIRVYPNPTNDIFTIDFGEDKFGVVFKLMDTKGALLDKKRYDSADKIKYKLTGKSGMYFISITNQNSFTSMLRVVKTN